MIWRPILRRFIPCQINLNARIEWFPPSERLPHQGVLTEQSQDVSIIEQLLHKEEQKKEGITNI